MTTVTLLQTESLEQVLTRLRAEAAARDQAADEAAAQTLAAAAAKSSETWEHIFADVKARLPAWARDYLMPHTPDSQAPFTSATLCLSLPFDSGPWQVTVKAELFTDKLGLQIWQIRGDYYHHEPYMVRVSGLSRDDDGDWDFYYREHQCSTLDGAVLDAAEASARHVEQEAELTAKNAAQAARAELYEGQGVTPSQGTPEPDVPHCTAEERAFLDALATLSGAYCPAI